MSTVLNCDPTHHGALTPAFYICSESIWRGHIVVNRHFSWSGITGEEAGYRKIRAAPKV
jgi:hypothetical protein